MIVIVKIKTWLTAHPWDALWLALAGLVGLLTGLWASPILLDDAMITFRVVENLAYGRGFVYNPSEWVQVTTTPLYALILVPGTWLLGSAPQAALFLNLTLAALIPMLAYDLGRRLSGRITGLGGALLLALAPLLIIAFSMESYLYVTLILASLNAYAARRWQLAGLLVGLTALVRGDAVLLAACMLTYDTLAYRRLRWSLILPAMAIPAAWYLFAMLYYGSPFPATLKAKAAQGAFNWLGKRFADGLGLYWAEWVEEQNRLTLYLFPVLMALGLVMAIRRERVWLILVARDVLYVTVFVALAVPAADWYYAPLMPGIALLTARGVQAVADGVVRLAGPNRLAQIVANGTAAILLTVLAATLYPISAGIISHNPDWKAQIYPDTARWIAANTSPSANLATIDIGHLGYWSGRPIVDIVGLAQPDVAPHIAEGDFGYAIRHYQPALVLLGYVWLPEVQAADWFKAGYVPRYYFFSKAMDAPLVLFSRRQGVNVSPYPPDEGEMTPLEVDFNQQIRLTGYHLNQPLKPGQAASLTLDWQAQAPIALDLTVFVQLVNAAGQIVAQGDGKPQDGFYLTPVWQPGERILDRHTFTLPADLPPGAYDILLGFYEAENGHRLQILDEAGQFKSDSVRLDGIQVQAP